MNIKLKLALLIVGGASIFFLCYYLMAHMTLAGMFDKKYTFEQLERNFNEHEKDFEDLAQYFKSIIPSDKKEYAIVFGIGKRNKVDLTLYPIIISPENKIIGGSNLRIGSKDLDLVLNKIGWSNNIVENLKSKLSKTNCDWIKTTDYYGGGTIALYPNQSGWSAFTYQIYDIPLSDSLKKIHGKTISESEFGKRVVLNYTSAL